MPNKLCQLLQIDCLQYRSLLQISLKLDFRSERLRGYRGSEKSKKRAFLFTIVFYLIISLVISLSTFQHLDVGSYAFLILSVSMLFMAMAVVIEFNDIVVNPQDAEILGPRPVSSRTYFWVKMTNLFFYVIVMGASLNLIPAIVGIWTQNSGYHFAAIYFLVSCIANLTTAAFVILLYSFLVRMMNFERFKDILAYVQIVFTFLLFFGYQFLPRVMQHLNGSVTYTSLQAPWNYLVPSMWYASIIMAVFGNISTHVVCLAGLGVVFTVVLFAHSSGKISLEYADMLNKLTTATVSQVESLPRGASLKNSLVKRLLNKIVPDPVECAGYELVSKYLHRDRSLKMRIYPSFAFPFAMIALFIYDGRFTDPFAPGAGFDTFFPLIFFVYVAMFFHFLLPTSDDWQAAWLYWVVPVDSISKIYWGAIKAVILQYVLPYFLAAGILLSTQMPVTHAAAVTIFNFCFFLAYYAFLSLFSTDLPLSKKYERGQSNFRFTLMVIIFPLFVIGIGLEYLIFRHSSLLVFAIGGLLFLSIIFWRISGVRLAKRFSTQEYLT